MSKDCLSYVLLTAWIWAGYSFPAAVDSTRCRCFPGDACWPSSDDWARLNSSVNGGLVATVPIGNPCHDPAFDAAQCKALQDHWLEPNLQ